MLSRQGTRKQRPVSPRISVAMPVYNGERFLAETLDSWLAQDLQDFELIVSDNASSDNTPRILDEYSRRDPRLRVLRRSDRVIAWENFNGLVEQASAPLFAWAASDDLRHPSYLQRLSAVLDRDRDAVLAYARTTLFGDPRRERRRARRRPATPGVEPDKLDRLISLLRAKEWYLIYGLIRTHVLRQTRLFVWPMGFNADVGLALELATFGRFCHVPEELVSFRLHPAAMSVDPSEPTHRGELGRRLDEAAQAFASGLDLDPRERQLFLRQLRVWCRKAQKPRHFLWKSAGFRSLYVRTNHALIDLLRL